MLRWVALILLLLLIGLQMKLWTGNGGVHEVETLRAAVKKQGEDNDKLTQRNQALGADVNDLKTGEQAVEARARAELGLIKPGETFYQVVEKPGAPAAPASAASSGGR
jgi:cell division protein FtsB